MSTPPGYLVERDARDTLHTSLPAAVESCAQMESMGLPELRNRINSLEMQGYGLYLRQIFQEFPGLTAIRIENSDNPDDNGRHISMIVEDLNNDEDAEALDQILYERADYLNNAIRHRGIYDYIDEVIGLGILVGAKIDTQLAKAYDDTFEDQGAWVRLRAEAEAAQLEHHTSTASTSTPRPRM